MKEKEILVVAHNCCIFFLTPYYYNFNHSICCPFTRFPHFYRFSVPAILVTVDYYKNTHKFKKFRSVVATVCLEKLNPEETGVHLIAVDISHKTPRLA